VTVLHASDPEVAALAREILSRGAGFCFRATGWSMHPLVQDGDILHARPLVWSKLSIGDILLVAHGGNNLLAHRLMCISNSLGQPRLITRGDALDHEDPPLEPDNYLGHVWMITRQERRIMMNSASRRFLASVHMRWPRITHAALDFLTAIGRRFRSDAPHPIPAGEGSVQ
jgi:hypothetical protein